MKIFNLVWDIILLVGVIFNILGILHVNKKVDNLDNEVAKYMMDEHNEKVRNKN